jgi:predicted nucleic acid-binding protein
MKSYFDSSALAKGYLKEAGTEEVLEMLMATEELGTCVLCLVEMMSALNRHQREGTITTRQYQDIKRGFLGDMADADIVGLNGVVVDRSMALLERLSLKAADALHIASALEWEADCFVSADKQQLAAAREAGLKCVSV